MKEEIKRNTRLCTKDGRGYGNAIVIDVIPKGAPESTQLYQIKTDYGTIVILTEKRLRQCFRLCGVADNTHKNSVHEYRELNDEAKIIARLEYREMNAIPCPENEDDTSLDAGVSDEDIDDALTEGTGYLFDGEGFLARGLYGDLLE